MLWSSKELHGTNLGDERFRSNAEQILDRISNKGDLSLSSCLGERLRKSCYNLTSKTNIDLLEGHIKQSVKRIEAETEVLVLTDTSDLNYSSHFQKLGMGKLGGVYKTTGICMHTALAVCTDGVPLGIIDQYTWAPVNTGRAKKNHFYPIEEKESYKWIASLKAVNKAFNANNTKVLVVSDREADFYEYFNHQRSNNIDLLVRGSRMVRNIKVREKKMKVRDLPDHFERSGSVEVQVSQQRNRPARKAKLDIKFGCFTYPVTYPKKGKDLELYFVHAKEQAHVGNGIEWYLFCTRPVTNLIQAKKMISNYSKR